MGWNKQRTSVGDRWGTGPTQVNGIEANVTLKNRVRSVYALDGRGQRRQEVPTQTIGQATSFSIGPKYKTLWYEIVAQ